MNVSQVTNRPKKITAGVLAGVLIFTTVGESLAQSNFWSDRQAARGAAAAGGFSDENQRQLRSIPWPKDSLNPVLGAYRLPAALGAVVETRPAARPEGPLVLHIQDAHGLYGAQLNASKILEGLRKVGWNGRDALTVFQEGGAGEAPVDWLAAFPDPEIKERVARAYLRRGDITGEEYRAVVASSGAFRLIGAETNDLYKRNLAARHDTAAARAAADRSIAGFQARLATLKQRLFPAPLLAIDKAVDGYTNQRHSFIEYMAALEKAAPKDVHWEKYPNLDRLHRITALESQMDLRAVADERDLVVRKMAARIGPDDLRRLADRAVEVRGGVLTPARFYEEFLTLADQLRRKGSDMPTQALRNYVGYLKLSETLKHDELMAEAEQLRARLLDRYSANDRLWRIVQTDRRVSLERLLWKQEMSPDQYAAFRQDGPLEWPDVDRYLAALETSLRLPPGSAGDLAWADSLPAVRAFYELALDRDIALVQNTLTDLKNRGESRGVLIAGGFHTPGLTRVLRQSGAGYVVVQPRFEADEPRRAEDLKISRDLAALGAATAREMNNLGRGTSELPLQRNLPAQIGAAAAGVAMTNALSLGERSRAYLEGLRDWLKGPASRMGLEIYSAHQLNIPEAKDLIVLYGRARGENFVFAFREGDAERGDRVSLMIGERELDGTDQINLAKRLPGVVESRGLLQWMRDTLGQIKGRTDTAGIQQTIRSNAPSYLTDVMALVSTAATATNRPILENSREGQDILNAAVKAVGAATQRAPTRVSGLVSTWVRRTGTWVSAVARRTGGIAVKALLVLIGTTGTAAASQGVVVTGFTAAAPVALTLAGLVAIAAVVYGVPRLQALLARPAPATVPPAPAEPATAEATPPAPTRSFSLGAFWIPMAVTVATYAGLVAFGFPAATELFQSFIASPALPGVTKLMLDVLVYGTEFLSQVTLLLTGLVIAARAVGPTAGGVFGRAVRALRPNMEGLDSTKGLLAQTGERSAVNRQTVREIVRARGLAAGFTAAFWRAAAFVVGDVWRTFYGFAFQKSDNLYLIWSGRGESVRGPPSLLEESFVNTDALLQKWGARPAFRRTATLLLLPIYATLGIFGKRLAVLAYSTLGQYALMTTLSWTLAAAVVPGGKMVLVAGLAVLGAAAFLRPGGTDLPTRARWTQRAVRSMIFLLPAAAIAFLVPAGGDALGLTAAVVNFNPLDLLMGTGWSAGFGHTGVAAAAVALAAPFVMASSYATSAVMRWVSGAQALNLTTLAERENLTQTKASRGVRALGWVRYIKASLFEPVHALPYQDADGQPVRGSLWRAAFHTAFAPRTLGFGGLHTVGLEIETAKWVAHLLGNSLGGVGRLFEHLIVKTEGDGERASVLAAGGQLLDRAGAGASLAEAAADLLMPSAQAAEPPATGETVETSVSEPVAQEAVPAGAPVLDVAQVATRGSSLNMRESPGRDAPRVGSLQPNQSPVMIYEYAAVTGAAGTEQWARVGVDQWVDARYLKIAPRAAEGVVDYATVQTQTRPLTVRSAPGVDKSAVDALPKGSPVGVLQYASVMTERGEEKWAKIGANHWVNAQYLAVHSPGPAATPAAAPVATPSPAPAAPALENLAQKAAELLPSLAAVPDPSLTVALPMESGVDRPVSEPAPAAETPSTAAAAPGALTQWAERAASVFAPMGAAVHHWIAGFSLAEWAMPVFTSFGVFGALHFWRRNPTPRDFSNWAEGVADRMLHELKQGPRTYPKTWGAAFMRWRRNQLSPVDQTRVDAAPAWRRWFLRSALLLQ
ncbi:MAG: SH3 domain-containing protein, partial [Elusimicrobia bacterium]|nr:SH3 domain-containing protein [Elusimicrobiota bacterium]